MIKKGVGCFIHETAFIDDDADVTLGDHVYIGAGVRILQGKVIIGDYSKIHNNVLINPLKYVILGHLSWIGQGTILDGTGGIYAGNYLGVGMNSALYSHIRHGDVLEGCNYDRDKQLIIKDDVWFVGQCLVSPIVAESKSMAMLGSVITSDMQENCIYGGNPAVYLSNKLGKPYKENCLTKKLVMMNEYLKEYNKLFNKNFKCYFVDHYYNDLDDNITYYNILDRTYTKRNTDEEIKFNKWLFKYKAKFVPRYEGINFNDILQ